MEELGDNWQQYDVIGIDEGQFFKDVSITLLIDQIESFSEKAAGCGKIVIMSVLGGTSFRKPFNDVLDLVPKCEKIKQLSAICKICYHKASFSLRTCVDDKHIELIGGEDLYMPVCRECFIFKTNQQSKRQ